MILSSIQLIGFGNKFVNESIPKCSFSRNPIAIPINENHINRSRVTSSDQKKTKLNNFLVMTCMVTMRIIDTKASRANPSSARSITSRIRTNLLFLLLSPWIFFTISSLGIAEIFPASSVSMVF